MKTIIVTIICMISLISYGQQSFEKIEKLSEQHLFQDAIDAYEHVLKKSPESGEAAFKLGECYFNLNDYSNAVQYFEKARELSYESIELLYQLGQCKLHLLKYAEAEAIFSLAKDLQAETDQEKSMLKECCSKALCAHSLKTKTKYESNIAIENLSFINSPYSEYGIYLQGNSIYFSSMRMDEKDQTDQRTLQGFSDLYVCNLERQNFENSELMSLNSSINKKKFNEACIVFNEDESKAYFMRCFGKPTHCEILESSKSKKGVFNSGNKINLASKDYSIGHPTLSSDGNTMVFVSDMDGGFGMRDLYISTKDGQKWSDPQNLGSTINSSSDEMFPAFYSDNILVFSSNGHGSNGGLDIFISRLESGEWSTPKQLATPINTGADDFGLVFKESEEHGYFCSNRPGGSGSDDIYAFNGYPVMVKFSAKVVDTESGDAINNAMIIIENTNGNDTLFTNENGQTCMEFPFNSKYNLNIQKDEYFSLADSLETHVEKSLFPETICKTFAISPDARGTTVEGVITDKTTQTPISEQQLMIMGDNGYINQATTNNDGHYEFTHLNDQTEYTLLLAKKGYWTITKTLEVPELENHKNYSLSNGYDFDFELVPIPTNEEIVINNIYYDFNKASLRQESESELMKLSNMLNQNPNIVIEISSHTDSRGSDEYNMHLSQARAESVVDFLIEQGTSLTRLIAKGYGENMPLIANAQSEGDHQKNRRTSFKVLEIKDVDMDDIMNHMAPENPLQGNTEAVDAGELIYKVQVCASKSPMENENYFDKITNSLSDIIIVEEKYPDGFYRYIAGTFISYSDAQLLRDKIVDLGYSDCFIGVFKNNKRIK